MRVPSTLDHLVPVLPGQRLRKGLCKVTWGQRETDDIYSGKLVTCVFTSHWCIKYTLKVTDDDFVVIGASQKVMGPG